MVNALTPIRHAEAKRVITHLFAHQQFNADQFVEILAAVMMEPPEVVKIAARHLLTWNTVKDVPRFVINDESTTPEAIAEVVLDAATTYLGSALEGVPSREATRADVEVWARVAETLRGSRDCFLRAASGSVSRGVFEAQAAACNRALDELRGNSLSGGDDKEI